MPSCNIEGMEMTKKWLFVVIFLQETVSWLDMDLIWFFFLTKTIHIDDELKSAKNPTLGSNPAPYDRPSRVITQPIWCEGVKLRQ